MIEPFMSSRVEGTIQHDLSADGVMRSMAIASALGATSSHTWLKVPVVEDMERVDRSDDDADRVVRRTAQ